MNDPFEFSPVDLSNPEIRRPFGNWRREMVEFSKLLCFSASWANPVLWSHYGDKHKGICLGFDVPDEIAIKAGYRKGRIKFPKKTGEAFALKLMTTKFDHWKYEREYRVFVKPDEKHKSGDHYFYHFDDKVVLREVVLGPRCSGHVDDVRSAIGISDQNVDLKKTRLAFSKFKVVTDQPGI